MDVKDIQLKNNSFRYCGSMTNSYDVILLQKWQSKQLDLQFFEAKSKHQNKNTIFIIIILRLNYFLLNVIKHYALIQFIQYLELIILRLINTHLNIQDKMKQYSIFSIGWLYLLLNILLNIHQFLQILKGKHDIVIYFPHFHQESRIHNIQIQKRILI
ncbi:unnamed protein product [Paramecium pentaurelia]|uniref:Transmembrane protein n=1 Tax=Paramecium pentaurelia TaxID=43138 RepID=A0A8S1VYF0_9CILI|nr:unnamed protein product [Paramecium pentaurelia]